MSTIPTKRFSNQKTKREFQTGTSERIETCEGSASGRQTLAALQCDFGGTVPSEKVNDVAASVLCWLDPRLLEVIMLEYRAGVEAWREPNQA